MAKNTKSLLHFDTNLTNSKNRNFDIIGNPQISNTESKFGKSLYLDGNSYLSTPSSEDFNFGTGDFTIEWWEYNISNPQFSNVIQIGGSKTTDFNFISFLGWFPRHSLGVIAQHDALWY